MANFLAALLRDDRGQDLTEYGLAASLIAIAAMAMVADFGSVVSTWWVRIVDGLPFL
jgi:Flp pilus assembly pilin Flp